MGMTHSLDDLLTPEETAKILRVAVSTLVRWRRESRRHGVLIGPPWTNITSITVRYRYGAIVEYAASREQRADG